MTQGTLVYNCQHFGGICCLYLLGRRMFGKNKQQQEGQCKTVALKRLAHTTMKEEKMFEMLVPMYQTTRHHITEDYLIMTETDNYKVNLLLVLYIIYILTIP